MHPTAIALRKNASLARIESSATAIASALTIAPPVAPKSGRVALANQQAEIDHVRRLESLADWLESVVQALQAERSIAPAKKKAT